MPVTAYSSPFSTPSNPFEVGDIDPQEDPSRESSTSDTGVSTKATELTSGNDEMDNREDSPPREPSAASIEVSKDTSEENSGNNTLNNFSYT